MPLTFGDMHPAAMPAAGPVDTADMLFAMTEQPDEPDAVQEDAGLPLGVHFMAAAVGDGLQALLDRPGLLALRDRLQEDRRRLQADNHSLQTDKTELEAENRRLETDNRSLQAQVRRFKDAWRQIAHISGCALKDTVRAP
jgi:FtsZ-binding cell division protein ZapB